MVEIDRGRCTGCAACVEACPNQALMIQEGVARLLPERCTGCGLCVEVCPQEAILLEAAPVVCSQELAGPAGQPAGRAGGIVTVRVPPPTVGPARQPPARQVVPALGAVLSFLGREVAPRLVRLAIDRVRGQAGSSRRSSSRRAARRGAAGERGPLRRRQRRGRR